MDFVLSGKTNASYGENVLKKFSIVSLRDYVIASIGLFGDYAQYKIFTEPKLRPILNQLLDFAELKVILPTRGGGVSVQEMEYEPQGFPSEFPRGSVADIIRVGYMWSGLWACKNHTEFRPSNDLSMHFIPKYRGNLS